VSRLNPLVRPIGRAVIIIAIVWAPQLPAYAAPPPALTYTEPFTAEIRPVTPDPRATPVEEIGIVFSGLVDPTTLSTANLTLSRTTDGDTVELPLTDVATLQLLDRHTVVVRNLLVFTAPDEFYTLKLLAHGIRDLFGRPLAADIAEEWQVDTLGPLVTSIGPVRPDPRTDSVGAIEVRFSEQIDPATFTTDDLTLTRDGTPLDLSGVQITRLGEANYRVARLAPLTGAHGRYTLTVNPDEIADLLGNTSDTAFARSDSWAVVVRPFIVAIQPVTPDPRNTPVDTLDVTFSEPIVLATFTAADMVLLRDEQPQTLAGLRVTALSATQFRVSGFAAATSAGGRYQLTVDSSKITDVDDGVAGSGSLAVSWTTDVGVPTAQLSVANIVVAGDSAHLLNVVYDDNLALAGDTIGTGDIRATGPRGFGAQATLVSVTSPSATQRIAVYRIAAPGGTWDEADNGVYQVLLAPNEVRDTAGNSAPGGVLGTFTVATPWRWYLPVVGTRFRM
jgi:hypothetical protein